ncbi:unnamed protein product [Closterium sp. Naga37s-1]|nr:unnamed protein product [Closterium sp. Naga37s-1]
MWMRLTQHYLRVPEGHTFGHGDKMHLPAFITAHGKADKRKMKVEGVDSEGTPASHVFELHERDFPDQDTDGDATACYELSTKFVRAVVQQLEKRLRDLSHLDGSKLFLSSKYLTDDDKRVAAFKRWLKQLHVLFRETLPGFNYTQAVTELWMFTSTMHSEHHDEDFHQALSNTMRDG